jgi:uncharacterized protein with PQ loop repeat
MQLVSVVKCVVLLFLSVSAQIDEITSVIAFNPMSLSLHVGETKPIIVRLLTPDIIPPNVSIEFLYDGEVTDDKEHIRRLPNITFTKQPGDDQSRMITVTGHYQGHLVITAQSNQANISSNYDFLLIDVARSEVISVLVLIFGWVYFVAWSVSFYPQIILNFRRQSVIGLNFDFLALNLIGHSCYSIYNICLYTSHDIQQQYYGKHPHSVLPVLLNDVSRSALFDDSNIFVFAGLFQCSRSVCLSPHGRSMRVL